MAGEKQEKAPSIHAGHRQGMKEQFLKQGLSGMRDHQILELLLFYAVPRRDVNPLAHRLVEHFGSLAGVFHATYDQLLEVDGVGPNIATLLLLVPAASARYLEESASVDGQIMATWQLRELLNPLFFGLRDEVAYLVCMDGKNKVLATRKLGQGVVDSVPIATRKVLEAALGCNASRVVLAHNHVSGVALWSQADLDTTLRLKRLLAEADIVLVDHVILAGGDMVSMAESGLLDEKR
ncbi:MAG: DNA repair protein RadC [Clostridiales bacterium]|nr:DNA repair protein RadC [Clostridiales bacterium]